MLSNSKPLIEGTVIMAENQFAGRGQHQNGWHAEAGKNLTFSLLLKPSFLAVLDQFDLTRIISLGVYDALEPLLGGKLKIKWPNDIYYADRKLGGMLIECIIQAGQIKNAIIGIGLNVNQQNFPQDLPYAVSLNQILHKDYDLKSLLLEICSHIEGYYLKLKAGNNVFVRKQYLERLYWLSEQKDFKTHDKFFKGIITGVKDNGQLMVQNNNGEQKEFTLKEIEFVR